MWKFFILTLLILLVALGILYTSVFQLNPWGAQGHIAFFAFFISVFCVLSSFFTLFFFFLKEVFSPYKLGGRSFLISFRRGIIISIFFETLLVLQFFRMLEMLEMLLLVAFLVLVEYIFSYQD